MKGKKKLRVKRYRPWFEDRDGRPGPDEEKGHRARDRERRELEEALEEALKQLHLEEA